MKTPMMKDASAKTFLPDILWWASFADLSVWLQEQAELRERENCKGLLFEVSVGPHVPRLTGQVREAS